MQLLELFKFKCFLPVHGFMFVAAMAALVEPAAGWPTSECRMEEVPRTLRECHAQFVYMSGFAGQHASMATEEVRVVNGT
jgi:hypothetical protein